jgi:prepilin-type N-terminal cleavage/methylation domain-containing protein
MRTQKHIRAFTIMEIMIVVVILGAIMSYAMPNYTRTVERTYVSDAMMQLTALYSANQIYKIRNGTYWPLTNGQDISQINSSLSLNIIPSLVMTYNCDGNGVLFTCTATRTGGGAYAVTVDQGNLKTTVPPDSINDNPRCTGTCP